MEKLRILLSVLLLWVVGIGTTTAENQNGITYEKLPSSGYAFYVIQRIETDATTLTIPSFDGDIQCQFHGYAKVGKNPLYRQRVEYR